MSIQELVESNPEVMGGTLVFKGTRVPVQTLFDCLKEGESIEDFLKGFPSLSKEKLIAFLEQAKESVLEIVKSSSR